ncbi:MAG: Hsp70 family protein [Deltaproteobacteria bacterium]|nr:Hsp70 family protein [Deltaproteobacteria bacterium]
MSSAWAIDLGTTNTAIARWDASAYRPRLVELPNVCRRPGGEDHLEAPRLIPSSTQIVDEPTLADRLGAWPPIAKRFFLGQQAVIGRGALELNEGVTRPSFVPTFKPYLTHEALRPIARAGGKGFSARDVTRLFVRELFAEVKRETGERIRDLAITTPVESFESYRAEILAVMKRLGVRRVRFIDEPVAAAIGYGLNIGKDRLVLVVDFGGGTLDLALVGLSAKEVQGGQGRVIAKEGRELGGRTVDRWLLEEFCTILDQPVRDDADEDEVFWNRLMLVESCRVKEAVYFREKDTFTLVRPDELGSFEARMRGRDGSSLEVSREMIADILERRGLFKELDACLSKLFDDAKARGVDERDVDDVLLVGGSTLLPGIYPMFERRFGRDRVRAWQPFEAVAYGACAFASESFTQSDFIVHDYAFTTYNAKSHEKEYTIVVPRGTRFPTNADFWKRQLVPTCSLGEEETLFKLVISEIGRALDEERRFAWDEKGNLHKLGGKGDAGKPLVVPLNESNPTLGYLKPPHQPNDRRPRLEISFGVNQDRWLFATVYDLKTKKLLMKEEPVVRLL